MLNEKKKDLLVGQKFEDLSKEEMNFITGGNDNTRISPTIVYSLISLSSAASSFVGSFTVSAYTKCR
jgi:type 2 lantibiotic (TIGR03893 family)